MSFDHNFDDYVVRLRGLPWSAEIKDVEKFMSGCGVRDINLSYTREGKMTGDAYVELYTDEDYKQALKRNREYIGTRYIDVLPSSRGEMEYNLGRFEPQRGHHTLNNMGYQAPRDMGYNMSRDMGYNMPRDMDYNMPRDISYDMLRRMSNTNGGAGDCDAVVRVRGLPFSCNRDMLLGFFDGFPTTPNGVFLMEDLDGRASGEAYIQFSSQSFADVAMQKNGMKIGHRYIEIFKSSLQEARNAIEASKRMYATSHRLYPHHRPHPYADRYDRGGRSRKKYDDDDGRNELKLYMRGLPFTSNEEDVMEFFYPINPTIVDIEMDRNGKSTGNASVVFKNEDDVEEALKRNRDTMKHRYIELFRSKPRKRN